MEPNKQTLNSGQQAAADGFFKSLFDDQNNQLIISGPGGVGKTFLMGHLIDEIIPRYEDTCQMMGIKPEYDSVQMTATTNPAADVLGTATGRPTSTIHSFLHLKVKENYTTGESELVKNRDFEVHQRKIIFIDESSMIDRHLLAMLHEGTHKCKLIFVGDHCQLAPIMEPISPIYRLNLPFYDLTQPMRNAGQPALIQLCQQLRSTVETGVFSPIKLCPGVVEQLTNNEAEHLLETQFQDKTANYRVLAYKNDRVVEYNNFARTVRNLPTEYCTGEKLINNTAVKAGKGLLAIEEEIEILSQEPQTQIVDLGYKIELEIRKSIILSKYQGVISNIGIPVDREHFAKVIKYFARTKNWERYYHVKGTYPDLRERDASTVHKAQGKSYDTIFIDLSDLSTCNQPNVVARMLYVAFTRARSRVYLIGKLADKYGGVIQ